MTSPETLSIAGGATAAYLLNPLAGVLIGVGIYSILDDDNSKPATNKE
ncbi:hypothetical protein [Thalassotalea sp. Y01]|nr:hypothetical protein [Thalassotalea sp. Y01]NMP15492.1 hypothetical protein [Thalassotalea sp. Y01]